MTEEAGLFASILENAVDAIITASEEGVIRWVNPSACRLFGYSTEELVGRKLTVLLPESHRSRHDEYMRRFIQTGEGGVVGKGRELSGVRKDGEEIPIHLSLSVSESDGSFLFTAIIRDLSDAKLREKQALAEAGARQVAEVQVALAGELHDGLLQILAGSMMQLRAAEQMLATNPKAAEARISAVREAISAEQKSIRMFVESFRNPEALVDEGIGLGQVLDEMAVRVEKIWGLKVAVTTDSDVTPSPAHRREILRLVQEASVNAARHGSATRIELSVSIREGEAEIHISDNGGGFVWHGRHDHEALRAERRGPLSLRRRIEAMGGKLAIESEDTGVKLEIRVPLVTAGLPPSTDPSHGTVIGRGEPQ